MISVALLLSACDNNHFNSFLVMDFKDKHAHEKIVTDKANFKFKDGQDYPLEKADNMACFLITDVDYAKNQAINYQRNCTCGN